MALTRHVIVSKLFDINLPQQRGQLMGSIISFPLLCIANAAVCRWAKEIECKRSILLKNLPLSINGDDAIIRCNEIGKEAWSIISTYCGLSPSVGKVYFSKYFLNINSTTYNYHSVGWEGHRMMNSKNEYVNRILHFELVKYVNLGLLYNLQRSGTSATSGGLFSVGKSEETLTSIGARARDLIKMTPTFLQEKVLSDFIHLNEDALKSYSLPWFIPEELGGIGLPCIGRWQANSFDLRVARKCYEHPELFPIITKPVSVQWKVWKYAMARMEKVPTSTTISAYYMGANQLSVDRLAGLFCIESLFRLSINDLLDESPVSAMKHYYRKLSRRWQKAQYDTQVLLPEPFNPERYPTFYGLNKLEVALRVNL